MKKLYDILYIQGNPNDEMSFRYVGANKLMIRIKGKRYGERIFT